MLMHQLQQERLVIAVTAVASCRRALDDTIAYVKERRAFGKAIAAFQNTQFKLAELATQVEVGQAFVDRLLVAHVRGDEQAIEAMLAMHEVRNLFAATTGLLVRLLDELGGVDAAALERTLADWQERRRGSL